MFALLNVFQNFQEFNRSPHVRNLETANIYLCLRDRQEEDQISLSHIIVWHNNKKNTNDNQLFLFHDSLEPEALIYFC